MGRHEGRNRWWEVRFIVALGVTTVIYLKLLEGDLKLYLVDILANTAFLVTYYKITLLQTCFIEFEQICKLLFVHPIGFG